MAKTGTNAFKLVRGDTGPDSTTADQDAAFGPAGNNRAANFFREIRIVDGGGRVGADVEYLVALLLQICNHEVF